MKQELTPTVFLNIPTATIPLSIRNSDKTQQVATFYDNSIVFYKQIVFTSDCTFSGANAPYTITQVDGIVSQLNTDIDTRFNLYYNKTYTTDLISLYYTKTESDDLYHNEAYINSLISGYYKNRVR